MSILSELIEFIRFNGGHTDARSIEEAVNDLYSVKFPSLYSFIDSKYRASYMHELWYKELNYDLAYEYFKTQEDINIPSGCSAFSSGNFLARNLDWFYSEQSEFIVHVPAIGRRFASVGVAGGFKNLTDNFVDSKKFSKEYAILPFSLYDGINEFGLTACMNVVPIDDGPNVAIPAVSEEVEISFQMVIRYILDYFKTATEAVEYMRDHMKIYFSKSIHDINYEVHYMIKDSTDCYVVEIVNDAVVIIEHNVMTNFLIDGVVFNDNGTVYTPANVEENTGNPIEDNHITPMGSGLERYNLIVNSLETIGEDITVESDARTMLNNLFYTKSYSTSDSPANPRWDTEFVGENNLTCGHPSSDFDEVQNYEGEKFTNRSRKATGFDRTWQTTHSVVYDISEKKAHIIAQESGDEIVVTID